MVPPTSIHQSDAPIVKWRHSQRRRGLRLMVLSTMNRRRDQDALNLPGDVALEAADDLSLALAFRGAPCDVLLGATISSHPSQTDHVQRLVGVPVATAVEAVAHYLSRESFHGRHSAQTSEGG